MLLAFALCAAIPPADARYVYRWAENGVDHYSDIEHAGAERVWVPDDAKAQGAAASARTATASPDGLKDPKSPEFRKMRCDQKQTQLRQYEGANKIVEKNAAGVEHEYTPAERDQLLARTRTEVASYCGEGETPP